GGRRGGEDVATRRATDLLADQFVGQAELARARGTGNDAWHGRLARRVQDFPHCTIFDSRTLHCKRDRPSRTAPFFVARPSPRLSKPCPAWRRNRPGIVVFPCRYALCRIH